MTWGLKIHRNNWVMKFTGSKDIQRALFKGHSMYKTLCQLPENISPIS